MHDLVLNLHCRVDLRTNFMNAIAQRLIKMNKRNKCYLILILFQMALCNLIAQDNSLDKVVSVDFNNVDLKVAINHLRSNYGIDFSYSNETLVGSKKVKLKLENKKVKYVLQKLLEGQNINFKLIGNKLTLYKKSSVSIPENRITPKYSISGYIEDLESGEKMIGANIYIQELGTGVSTNVHGYYSLTLPEGRYNLEITYIGFQLKNELINLDKNLTRDINLNSSVEMEEVEIVASKEVYKPSEKTQMSSTRLNMEVVKTMPAIGGEIDVLKIAQLKPGVSSGTEGSSGVYVRGGNIDQNLILMDGVPVYNPAHLFGFVSVFNEDAINSMEILKGAFPARYNGRLSSVIDVRMKDGNRNKTEFGGTISPIASKLYLQGPLNEKTSYMITGRRTFMDLIMRPIIKSQRKKEGINGSAGYYFYDINAKINHRISDKDQLFLSFFGANDKFDDSTKENSGRGTTTEEFGLNWSNILGSFRWNHRFANKAFGNFILSNTKYRFNLVSNKLEEFSEEGSNETRGSNFDYGSKINDYSVRYNLDYIPNQNHYIRIGAYGTLHKFKPGVTAYSTDESGAEVDTIYNNNFVNSTEIGLFVEDDIAITSKININLGIATNAYFVEKETYTSFEPRVSLAFRPTSNTAFKASYSEMNQYLHLLANSGIGLPTDLWVSTSKKIKPQRSKQFALGIAHDIENKYSITLESYYKTMNNLIDYKQGASFLVASERLEEKVSIGKGKSYGIELEVSKNIGNTTGWLSYTWSTTNRTFDDLNNGEEFPFAYDKRHDLSLVANHKINNRWTISGTWSFATGRGITLPISHYAANQAIFGEINYAQLNAGPEQYGQKNSYRLKSYHRLDLSISYTKPTKWGENTFRLSLYNAYSRHNTFYIKRENDLDGPRYNDVSLFPILPGISYSFKFK